MKKFNLGTGVNNQSGDDGKTVGNKLNQNFLEIILACFGQNLWDGSDERLIDMSLLKTTTKKSLLEAINELSEKGVKKILLGDLIMGESVEYDLPENSLLMAIDFSGSGYLKTGSNSGKEDYGSIQGEGVLNFGFLKIPKIWLEADSDGSVEIIVFKK
ncbi:hypothetical protein BTO06_01115 [Tenacibaculum sp. SZ-18]|uniref:hypothetical protein n=1 Tax=Tenacibaculum sp. SZ-18 TaxID=754423 RepID=UPI000C2D3F00|nr:hypothetical protein [Tenacibaculum sp. SZ-18]AUC13834.1 hypothetical protein BTO06_01115 [Tenacibaculum sp. SZ-18]